MIKYKPIPTIEISEEGKEILFYNGWLFNSHYWLETDYYLSCKWCGDSIAKNHYITSEKITWNLCLKNPYIQDRPLCKKKGEGE